MKKTRQTNIITNRPSKLVHASADKPTMILVLGMHRSGTSVSARLMECLGGSNSTNLMPPTTDNKYGYFEDSDISNFNENELMPELGVNWQSVQFADWSTLNSSVRGKLGLRNL